MGERDIKLQAGTPAGVASVRCCWSERWQRKVAVLREFLQGAMERCGTAGFRNPDALLSIVGKSGKVSTASSERAECSSLASVRLLWGRRCSLEADGHLLMLALEKACRESRLSAHPSVGLRSGKGAAKGNGAGAGEGTGVPECARVSLSLSF